MSDDNPLRSVPPEADLRTEVGRALEPIWWIRQYLDDESDEAKAFDEVRAYAQGDDTCPVCGGAGIIDTSPPGVEHTAPWLQTDTDCGACGGTGEIDPTTYEPDIEEG